MRTKNIFLGFASVVLAGSIGVSCTKLDQKIYTPATDQNFWKTSDQIAAGIAPAYQALTNIPDGNVDQLNELSGGEIIVPTRGNDWYDNGNWQALWLHTWKPDLGPIDGAWSDIFNGIGKANFTLSVVNALPQKPSNIDAINAELKVLRAYYYYLALDMFGNVPLVTDFNTDPSKVTNSSRAEVYAFVEKEVKDNLSLLPVNNDANTYGRLTQWAAHMILAKLYLNAQVYTGTAQWANAITEADAVINSGKYSLTGNYFDNFAVNNQGSSENIFVVPFDKTYISGNNWEMQTLHYQSQATFNLTGSPWNGFCSTADYLNQFDDADNRKTQFLVGQQYGSDGTPLKDAQTSMPLVFNPVVHAISDPAPEFRLAGARNVKYRPEGGTSGNQSNDMVLFRLADAYMVKAEAEVRSGNVTDALDLVNKIRERAYGNTNHNWTAAELTLPNLYAERQREFAWEGWSRQDAIRFGTFGNARNPAKAADPDTHTQLFPIPAPELSSNPNLKQNPGY
jgi:hypothetical protein